MDLRSQIKDLLKSIEGKEQLITYNKKLLEVYEGDLLKYIERDLMAELSTQSYLQAKQRISPINVLIKIIDKLSKIYQQQPSRQVVTGTDLDSELLSEYEYQMGINKVMNTANEFFNLFKYCLIEPFIHEGSPRLRAIPNDRFIVWSNDRVDPTNPTHVVVMNGLEDESGSKMIYTGYSKDEIVMFDSAGNIRDDLMEEGADGINPIGRLPFVYVNRSAIRLMPQSDTDTFAMTKIIPILLSDLNYAIKFQSFSIIYGIDIDNPDLVKSPGAFWELKSDPTTDKKPEIGSIKPEVDIQSVHTHIAFLLATWLQSKGIRPGAIGNLDAQNVSSGISKIIDEMDTVEERQKQVTIFKEAEDDLWHLITQSLHPYWVRTGMIEERRLFSRDVTVEVRFAEQLPLTSRGSIVRDLRDEYESGFTSKKRVIATLNPELSETEIEEMLTEIDEEKQISLPANNPSVDNAEEVNLDGLEQVRSQDTQGDFKAGQD